MDAAVLQRADQLQTGALAESETAEMLDAATVAATGAAGDAVALRDRAILELLYAGGVRVSELTGLHTEDLQLDAGRVMVRGKGDKERVVPVGRAAVEALTEYLERGRPLLAKKSNRGGGLFLSQQGRTLTRGWIWCLVKNKSAAGLPAHAATQLRHSHGGARRRSAHSTDAAGTLRHRDHAGVYASGH